MVKNIYTCKMVGEIGKVFKWGALESGHRSAIFSSISTQDQLCVSCIALCGTTCEHITLVIQVNKTNDYSP